MYDEGYTPTLPVIGCPGAPPLCVSDLASRPAEIEGHGTPVLWLLLVAAGRQLFGQTAFDWATFSESPLAV